MGAAGRARGKGSASPSFRAGGAAARSCGALRAGDAGRARPGAAARAACGKGLRCRSGLAGRGAPLEGGRGGERPAAAGLLRIRGGRGGQPAGLAEARPSVSPAPAWGCPGAPGAFTVLSGANDPGGAQR